MINILDGKTTAKKLRIESLAKDILKLSDRIHRKPKLVVIQVGEDKASSTYVNNKSKACSEVGIDFVDYHYDKDVPRDTLTDVVNKLNADNSIDGIIIQQPLPKHLIGIEQLVSSEKDVDGFTKYNQANLLYNNKGILPCTPLGILALLKEYNISVEGKNIVIVGRSNIVGKPLALMLTNLNATVTLCHSKTKDLYKVCNSANILITAIGKPKLVDNSYISNNIEVIVDVGINRLEDGTLCGDCDYEDIISKLKFLDKLEEDKPRFITPVPGGIGPMTIYGLLCNTYIACLLKNS